MIVTTKYDIGQILYMPRSRKEYRDGVEHFVPSVEEWKVANIDICINDSTYIRYELHPIENISGGVLTYNENDMNFGCSERKKAMNTAIEYAVHKKREFLG